MMKKVLFKVCTVLLLMLVCNYSWADCGKYINRLAESDDELTLDLNQLLNTKQVLSNYNLDKERTQQIEDILMLLGSHMIENIYIIIEDNLHRKRTGVEKKVYSVVPQLDRSKTNKLKLWNKFRNGKISEFSLESFINEEVEKYNDKHLYNRLHTVSLKLPLLGSFLTDSFYERLVSKEWKNAHNKQKIIYEILKSYCRMFQSEKLIEQLIGKAN